MVIKNKAVMYDCFKRGLLGNRLEVWDTPEELLHSGFSGLVGVRCLGDRPGLPYRHYLSVDEGIRVSCELSEKYGCKTAIYEASDDEHIMIQGEVRQTFLGLILRYTTAKTHMRAAFRKEQIFAEGLRAHLVVKDNFWGASYDDLQVLFEEYPDHVVEFTCYDCCYGILKGRNTVIWEVRAY